MPIKSYVVCRKNNIISPFYYLLIFIINDTSYNID